MDNNNTKINKKKNKKNLKAEKLKLFLEQPIQHNCPNLNDDAMKQLFEIFKEDFENSGESPSHYARTHNVKVGLESVLRGIYKKECIYVLFSTKIKPSFVLTMLSKTVKTIDPAMLDYAHKDVDKFTKDIFGQPTMAFAICKGDNISPVLQNWIDMNKYERIMKETPRLSRKRKHLKPIIVITKNDQAEKISKKRSKTIKKTVNADDTDFISIGGEENNTTSMTVNPVKDQNMLDDALQQLRAKVEKVDYQPLTVKKIKKNPDKIKKKHNE